MINLIPELSLVAKQTSIKTSPKDDYSSKKQNLNPNCGFLDFKVTIINSQRHCGRYLTTQDTSQIQVPELHQMGRINS